MPIDLNDAQALRSRAARHLDEFRALVYGDHGTRLWQLRSNHDAATGEWEYSIHLDRERLLQAKPILADAATNTISALDHVAAAIARSQGHGRVILYFPLGLPDDKYQAALARAEPYLGAEMAAVLTDVRTKRYEHIHTQAAKEISNSGKHWELLTTAGAARAVGIHEPGQQHQRIFQIPQNAFDTADQYVFHRGERLPNVPFQLVSGLDVGGLSEGLPTSPDTIIQCAIRYVEAIMQAVDQHEQAPAEAENA